MRLTTHLDQNSQFSPIHSINNRDARPYIGKFAQALTDYVTLFQQTGYFFRIPEATHKGNSAQNCQLVAAITQSLRWATAVVSSTAC